MNKKRVRILLEEGASLPIYMTSGSAGADLHASIVEPISIDPMKRIIIPTGISLEIPEGFEVQLRPRSGLAFKKGLTLLNTPGTIDSDYRGEVKIILINLGEESITINPGDRIAQMVLNEIIQADFEEADSLEDTDRSSGGIGHTGV